MSVSSGAVHLGRTNEALTRTSLVPIPVLVVGFKSSGIAVTGARNSFRSLPQAAQPSAPSIEQAATSEEPRAKPEPPVAAPDNGAEQAQAKDRRPPASSQGDSIELIIDKLPRHALVKPIPVTISPLGDRVFIASTPDLDITVTGNSLSDALLLLKQQLESTYENLRGKASGREEERQMKKLREYIRDH
jgi:hypothetical protein